jgi:hypothetical protein
MAATATARRAPAAAPPRRKPRALKAAPARNAAAAPARKVPARHRAPARRPGGQLIPIAAGAATAVRQLPDSGLIVRMTRGRLWIGVLGVLLAGIVAINVVTLSLSASAAHIERNIQALEEENPILRSRDAERSGVTRVRHDAAALGLSTATSDQIGYLRASRDDAAVAAQRLAAAAGY